MSVRNKLVITPLDYENFFKSLNGIRIDRKQRRKIERKYGKTNV